MEIYLDANATTPVLDEAREAAMAAMSQDFGNPSSIHGTGLKARAIVETARACARRVLGAPTGQVLFLGGATEGIQTSILSALTALRERRARGELGGTLLLYGATEHKAVPEAIRHWNTLLGLGMQVLAIPVGADGRHDLGWLRAHAPRAGLVCTMAANNETGVVSDLDGIAGAISGSHVFWVVDCVQALGKMRLRLADLPIDYAPFSGHKLYAPKGVGMLYVREGAPFTPLMAGGGQESGQRSGTENVPGIAAFGSVLAALEEGRLFKPQATLERYRQRLVAALCDAFAFPGIRFNAPADVSLPTTLNFSVPGVSSRLMLDLFDAAQLRASGGSACSASKAQPSHVLEAMGLPHWQTVSAVRLSFGPASDEAFIAEACERIRQCGVALGESCLTSAPQSHALPPDRLTRFIVDGACCYILADAPSRRCVVIDPLPQLTEQLCQWMRCRNVELAAALDTHCHGDHVSSARQLKAAMPASLLVPGRVDALGWPLGADDIWLGALRLTRVPIPGHTKDSTAYLLTEEKSLLAAFVGDTLMPGSLGRSDFKQSEPLAYCASLRTLAKVVGMHTLLLPGHDYGDRFACTLATERDHQPLLAAALDGTLNAEEFAAAKADIERDLASNRCQTVTCGARVDACASAQAEVTPSALAALMTRMPRVLLVDVRERHEQRLGQAPALDADISRQAAPLSSMLNALPGWLALADDTLVIFFCRSGNRSAQAARALRRLGHARAWSLAGGLALWPKQAISKDMP